MKSPATSIMNISSILTGIISIIIALSIPTAHFIYAYQYMTGAVNAEMTFSARVIEGLVVNNPDSWQYEESRLKEILEHHLNRTSRENMRIKDLNGHVLAETNEYPAYPVITMRRYIYDSGVEVALIESECSIAPVIFRTIFTGVFSTLFGIMVFLLFYFFPLKTVRIAYKNLQESEERIRSIISTSQEWIWAIDTDGIHTFSNPAVENILGYRPDEIVGCTAIPFLIYTEDIPKMNALVKDSIRNGTGWSDIVLRWNHRDGTIRYLESFAMPVFDSAGVITGFHGSDRDITQRQQAEDSIKKSEELYRTIFESTSTANIIINEDSTIRMANNNFAELSGYTKKELEGKISWDVLVHKDDLEKMKNYHKMRRINPDAVPTSYEIRSIGRKNGERNLLLNAAIIPETKESVISIVDITEWKRLEKARIESEERFRELAELLPETVYEADINGIFTFVNNSGYEKFGYNWGDLLKGTSIFDLIVPEEHTAMIETYRKLIKGERVALTEYTGRRKDGSAFPVLVQAMAIFNNGKVAGHRGFVIDISEKKNMEDQLSKAKKMEAIGTLAGGIAHDFNNLLMGILGNISLILMKMDESDPVYKRLKSVEEYVQRGSSLTNQLLGFARGGKYEVKSTDIGMFIQNISELFGRTRKEIHIHHRAQDGLCTVDIDQGQIEQVLINMYLNASHAMPDGGDLYLFEENVELDSSQVKPYGIEPGRFVRLTVQDTGTGMDETTKARIFEPFFTTREPGHGTGLGLASAYGIIGNHGGFINVESEKGTGTTFEIYLPASAGNAEPAVKSEDCVFKGNETILLVDDEEMILDVTAEMLRELGYNVITASGGIRGIKTYEQKMDKIDLVILDMIMPDVSGKEAFDEMKRINPHVKILLSSGYSLDSHAKEIIQHGSSGFIQKPFVTKDLSKKIRGLLDKG